MSPFVTGEIDGGQHCFTIAEIPFCMQVTIPITFETTLTTSVAVDLHTESSVNAHLKCVLFRMFRACSLRVMSAGVLIEC
jgi:hypothetical protein